jgi:hypothetical protein
VLFAALLFAGKSLDSGVGASSIFVMGMLLGAMLGCTRAEQIDVGDRKSIAPKISNVTLGSLANRNPN